MKRDQKEEDDDDEEEEVEENKEDAEEIKSHRKNDYLKQSISNEPIIEFCSGSHYDGMWNSTGMQGNGSYNFFYGVDYDGNFNDSLFHERGTLIYPNEMKIDGFWENGHLKAHRYFYSDNLCYGPYCTMPDRRFYIEITGRLNPAGRSYLTNSYVTRNIPPGCYDTGDGFYDPSRRCVYDANNPKRIIRIPSNVQHNWILENCRKSLDEQVGYKPILYENWPKDDASSTHSSYSEHTISAKKLARKIVDGIYYRRHIGDVNLNPEV